MYCQGQVNTPLYHLTLGPTAIRSTAAARVSHTGHLPIGFKGQGRIEVTLFGINPTLLQKITITLNETRCKSVQ